MGNFRVQAVLYCKQMDKYISLGEENKKSLGRYFIYCKSGILE